jgi:ribonucleoside-diphosphate reductase alpha subunit
MSDIRILKRDGSTQAFLPNKIKTRIATQAKGLKVNVDELFIDIMPYVKDGISTTELDEVIAFRASDKAIVHPDYSMLGGRILMTRQAKIIGVELSEVDLKYDFFAAVTFISKYSKKSKKKEALEVPSMMYERVAGHLHGDNEDYKKDLLNELHLKRLNFATPTYTNAGIPERNALISCNLTMMEGDSLEEIQNTLTHMAMGSKEGSGIGTLLDLIRSRKSIVGSFNNNAAGIVRFCDMAQGTMRFYKQGDRSGSCAPYLSTWHKDILEFLELNLPVGIQEMRCRDLFIAVVIDDVFMNALLNSEKYYLFCPNDILKAGLKPLYECWGEEFKEVYSKAVELGLGEEIKPKKIWDSIIRSQVESGRPYVFYKDNANKRNMQDNIGVIKQSNLCCEITSVSSSKYTSQCTLASINLAEHSDVNTIAHSTKVLVRALNRVIDVNKWSDDWSEAAGVDQRSIAIGVAGMADFFAKKRISFESEEAKEWNHKIFSTMYKAAVEESHRLAVEQNRTYPAWEGSRYSKGETYIEGWSPLPEGQPIPLLNSLFLGLMPTASSAILLSVFESFQPIDSNLYVRSVGQGQFIVINKYLVEELEELGLWNKEILDKIVANGGSIQSINEIPSDVRHRAKTVWEIPQKCLLDLAAIRNQYVDQSQSMNVYHSTAKYEKISSALVYAWKIGLKTGVYYTRTMDKRGENTKLSASEVKSDTPKKPADSIFSCAGGGCDA